MCRRLSNECDGNCIRDRRNRGLQSLEVFVSKTVFQDQAGLTLCRRVRAVVATATSGLNAPNDDVVRTEPLDLFQRFAFRAFANCQHGNYGTRTKNDSKHRQQAAELVQQEILDANFDGV